MLKSKDIYTDKIASKAFLLDKFDLNTQKKQDMQMDEKEHIGIRFDNIEKLEEYKQLKNDYKSCLKMNQMWNSYIDSLITEK